MNFEDYEKLVRYSLSKELVGTVYLKDIYN